MPKAVKGTPPPLSLLPLLPVTPQFPTLTTLASPPGVLIQCDPAIRAIILKLDSPSHEFIVDDLDEQTLVVKESRLGELKTRLDAVRYSRA
jgi:TFIIH basal transcription factor complex TTD-A subunit